MAANPAAGRKAKPPALKIVTGRGERRDGQMTDSGGRVVRPGPAFERTAPVKPEGLSEDASWLWDQVVEQMMKVGLLKPLDAAGLEVACETFARFREAVRFRKHQALLAKNSQGVVAAPWIGIEERASRDFRSWCAEFGFTPASEKNLMGAADDEGDLSNPF